MISQENQNAMKKLCRFMQSTIVEQLLISFKSIDHTITHAAGYAMQLLYVDIKKSGHSFRLEAESCKFYLLNCLFFTWVCH